MSLAFVLACLWVISAWVVTIFPSKRSHWPAAYVLITIGIPLLGYITYRHGPWAGLLAMLVGVSVLRWPVRYLWRWVRAKLGRPA